MELFEIKAKRTIQNLERKLKKKKFYDQLPAFMKFSEV